MIRREPTRGNDTVDVGMQDTHAHNTLSAETTHVQVFYPFSPTLWFYPSDRSQAEAGRWCGLSH